MQILLFKYFDPNEPMAAFNYDLLDCLLFLFLFFFVEAKKCGNVCFGRGRLPFIHDAFQCSPP